jgi:hypothetical protein
VSAPPTISRVGASTCARAGPAGRAGRHGRPPPPPGRAARPRPPGGGRTRAGPEQSQAQLSADAGGQPVDGIHHASGKQGDVEAELAAAQVELLLIGGEQVQQQGAEAGPLEVVGDLPVAGGCGGCCRCRARTARSRRFREAGRGRPRASPCRLRCGWPRVPRAPARSRTSPRRCRGQRLPWGPPPFLGPDTMGYAPSECQAGTACHDGPAVPQNPVIPALADIRTIYRIRRMASYFI